MENSIKELLVEVTTKGINLYVDEGKLRFKAPRGVMTAALREQLKHHRVDLVKLLKEQQSRPKMNIAETPIPKIADSNYYALSNAQRRLWVLDQLDETLSAYNMPAVLRLQGPLDIEVLEQTFQLLIERHEVLRTRFIHVEGTGKQVIDPVFEFKLAVQEVSDETQALELAQAHADEVFDLAEEYLLKVRLLQVSEAECFLLFNMHHIISDGWSMGVLINEISRLYHTLSTKSEGHISTQLPALSIQYKDFAAWQNTLLEDEEVAGRLRSYWKEQLTGLSTLELPLDAPRPKVKTYSGAEVRYQFPRRVSQQLEAYNQERRVTLFMTLTALVNALLYRYTHQSDITIGTPTAGRNHPDLHHQLGLYVNTLVLRNQVDENVEFKDFLHSVRSVALAAFEHEMYPFDRLVEDLQVARDLSRAAVFDVLLVLQNNEQSKLSFGEVEVEVEELEVTVSKFDLTFSFEENSHGLAVGIEYNTDLFRRDRIERMCQHLECLINSVLRNDTQSIASLNLLPNVERTRLLEGFNNTARTYPLQNTYVQLFEEQVARTPDKTALVFEDTHLTYRELNDRSTQLAHYLRNNYHTQADDIIALQLDRSEWMLIGILGIMKSGAAYLPIAPDFPSSRVSFMLKDSGAKLLLSDAVTYTTSKTFSAQLPVEDIQVIPYRDVLSTGPVWANSTSSALAYVIYTSGSTGQPKGVMIEHMALVNFLSSMQEVLELSGDDKFLASTTYTFDISILEFLLPLVQGATLLQASSSVTKSPVALQALIKREEPSLMQATPSLWQLLIESGWEGSTSMKLLCGGEALPRHLAQELGARCATLWNMYGPTETTIWSSVWQVEQGESVSIGNGLGNTSLYILDQSLALCPIGVTGDLYISGAGLARGYLNKPELTAEKFIDHPFSPGQRLYKTGDLAQWRPNGTIEFLGRSDFQLKIRGYRIEAGEIEQILLTHEAIQAAVVVGYTINEAKELVAYLVPKEGAEAPDAQGLRSLLAASLPAYMIPSQFILLDSLPLSASGKVDRNALPKPDNTGIDTGVAYVAPSNTIEESLVKIWQDLLQRELIGINDNFFNLGGHSLRAIRLLPSIQDQFSVSLRLSEVFAYPTIADLAQRIEEERRLQSPGMPSIPAIEEQSHYALSNAQRRLWVLDQMERDNRAYNMPAALRLEGVLDIKMLEKAFQVLVERHEVLRTRFVNIGGKGWQVVDPVSTFALEVQEVSGEAEVRAMAVAHASSVFQLDNESAFKVRLLKTGREEHLLLVNMHHIISDAWSMDLLIHELAELYQEFTSHPAGKLETVTTALPIQYKDFAAWQNALLEDEGMIAGQRAYWRKQLSDLSVLSLPQDFPRPALKTYNGDFVSYQFPKELSAALSVYANQQGATLFMTLTALLKVLLYRYSNQENIIIGTPIAGRNHPDLHNQIGFYVNTLVLRNEVRPDHSFRQFLQQVKRTSLEAFEYDLYPFDQLVEELEVARDLSRSPVFDVMLVWQDQAENILSFGDIDHKFEEVELSVSKFDLSFNFAGQAEGLMVEINYNTDLFLQDRIERMFGHLESLMTSVLKDHDKPLSQLQLLPTKEVNLLQERFQKGKFDPIADSTIVKRFEAQVSQSPDRIALAFEKQQLTYRELNERSNQLAHYLRDTHHIQIDDIVGIRLERSEWMIIAILGVLKSGAAYLPLAPDYPASRLEFMLKDSQAKVLLTDSDSLAGSIPFESLLPIENLKQIDYTAFLNSNPDSNVLHAQALAYIIYTSGSSGVPKGVMVEHRNFINFVDHYKLEQHISVLTCNFIFDVSVMEILATLLSGSKLVIPKREVTLDVKQYANFLYEQQVSHAYLHPFYLEAIAEELSAYPKVFLQRLLIGVDMIQDSSIEWYKSQGIRVINGYGPSETTICSSMYEVDNGSPTLDRKIPIGRPLLNTEILILDHENQLQPIGVPGELCISGLGLSRGYVNNSILTTEKFVDHPYEKGDRMYKTGDLACWLPDGNIEFLGRVDFQLKIRGHRIEAGEIEQALLAHDTIQSAVVLGYEAVNGKELLAYLVPKPEGKVPEISALRSFLAKDLPAYMLPTHFVALERLPLTTGGKVDRKALPQPEDSAMATGIEFVAPRDEKEEALAKAWQMVLRKPGISVNDNFFHVGGDSIKAIQIVAQLGQQDWQLEIKDLFSHPTIAGQASILKRSTRSYDQGAVTGAVSLTAIQRRFFEVHSVDPQHYNQAIMLEWQSGKAEVKLLTESVEALIVHHDMLRASYVLGQQETLQLILTDSTEFGLEVIDLTTLSTEKIESYIEKQSTRLQSGFNLSKGGLIKVALFSDDKGRIKDQVLIAIHHLLMDGVSWRILLEDLQTTYDQLLHNQSIQLPKKTASYQLWAEKIGDFVTEKLAQDEVERAYWASLPTTDSLSTDQLVIDPSIDNTYGATQTISTQLSRTLTHSLLKDINRIYHTEINDLLLAALSMALGKVYGLSSFLIDLEGHGREDFIDLDISRTVGWFTAVFPFTLKQEDPDLGKHLQRVKEALRNIPRKGLGYGLLRYCGEAEIGNQALNPAISFNYLGDFALSQPGDSSSHFAHSTYEIGEAVSPSAPRSHELDVAGYIAEDQLVLSLSFVENRLDKSKVNELLQAYERSLVDLIQHCVAIETPQFTPSDFTGCPMDLEEYVGFLGHYQLQATAIDDIYPLSPMQEGMLFHWMLNPSSVAYSLQTQVGLSAALDLEGFTASWKKLVKRHEILRTVFVTERVGSSLEDQRPLQIVLRSEAISFEDYFEIIDLSHLTDEAQGEAIAIYREKDLERGYDLAKLPLIRLTLFNLGAKGYQFLQSVHHILQDGWGIGVLFKELVMLYEEAVTLPAPTPYSQYIQWLEGQSDQVAHDFWSSYLQAYEAQPLIPELKPEQSGKITPKEHLFRLSKNKTKALEALASKYEVSLNTVLQAMWGILLGRYNQRQDVVFGMTTSGRSAKVADIENMVGLFINTIPVRINWSQDESFATLLSKLGLQNIEAQAYEYYPLAEIQQLATQDGSNLFDHVIIFENYPVDEQLLKNDKEGSKKQKLEINSVSSFEAVHYGMGLYFLPGEKLGIKITWNEENWSSGWVNRLESHMLMLIDSILQDDAQAIGELQVLPDQERSLLLETFNDTAMEYPADSTLVELFEEQVNRTPNKTALIFEGQRWTYQQLNEKANQLARYLNNNYHIEADTVIALQLERTEWMIIAILGVMKSGGAYLPIAPDFPPTRVEFMLKDSGAKALLTDQSTLPLSQRFAEQLAIENLEAIDYQAFAVDNLRANSQSARQLAYVIYTSGSTGQPKGVMIEHAALINFLYSMKNILGFQEEDVFLASTTYTFDISILELLLPLVQGATLLQASSSTCKSPADLQQLIEEEQPTTMQATPAMWQLLLESGWAGNQNMKLLCGGEALPAHLANELVDKGIRLWNMYGPTETTIWSSYWKVEKGEPITIGNGLGNTGLHILDEGLSLCPIGVVGDLYISGAGLARGYLNKPELTEERFIPHPFLEGESLYKTGDLARRWPNGNIEFLGRSDFQLKIRGYRIEAGEIEQALVSHEAIQTAVVVGYEFDNGKELVGYLVPTAEQAIPDLISLRTFLQEVLPEYMIPGHFVTLQQLPLSSSGKVNRKALPQPDHATMDTGTQYVAPRNEVERTLADIWESALQREGIGIQDNFFSLGGHSLRALRIVSSIKQLLAVEVKLSEFFANPTISGLAQEIDGLREQRSVTYQEIPRIPEEEHYALSNAQRRLWIPDQLQGNLVAYNMPFTYRVEGQLDVVRLEKVFETLIHRHEILRTRLITIEGEPRQVIDEEQSFSLPYHDFSDKYQSDVTSYVREHHTHFTFDLSKDKLVRVELLQLGEDDHLLLMNTHHIISDGWSIGVLIQELTTLYEAYAKGEKDPLIPLRIQYKDYVAWQEKLLADEDHMDKMRSYWRRQLNGVEALAIPTDHPRPMQQAYEGDTCVHLFDESILAQLEAMAQKAGTSLFVVLTGLVKVLLYRYTNQKDIVIGTSIAGRNHQDLYDQIGFYVNALALRSQLDGQASFQTTLSQLKETVLEAFEHDAYPFDLMVEELEVKRDLSRHPIFDVSVVLQNNETDDLQLGNLALEPIQSDWKISKFDLTFFFDTHMGQLRLAVEYSTSLFERTRIERMLTHFETLLKSVLKYPEQAIAEAVILPESEATQLLSLANTTTAESPKEKTIVQLFEAQVKATPDQVAVICGDQQLTYLALNNRANQLASYLHATHKVAGNDIIALRLERSEWMIIAILGVLKSGAAYLPIADDLPAARVEFLLQDSQAKLMLADAQTTAFAEQFQELLPIQDIQAIAYEDVHLLSPAESKLLPEPDALAYVIYTSGSTGRPKGVEIAHSAVQNYIVWANQFYFDNSSEYTLPLFASIAFDMSITTIFSPILRGATIQVYQEGEVNTILESIFAPNSGIKAIKATPSHIELLAAMELEKSDIEKIIVGGEALQDHHVATLLKLNENISIYNEYGPTESTVGCTVDVIEKGYDSITIGRPIANTEIYILDDRQVLAPMGVPGELYVAGDGLARGYLNNPRLTAEKFVPHPFKPGERLYRTGDLARWLTDAKIEYLGRTDFQLKIRGHRIEAGEIEQVILEHPAIKSTVVLGREDENEKVLQALIVPELDALGQDDQEEAQDEILKNWEDVFELSYDYTEEEVADLSFDIAGWTDSYTNQPIPAPEMKEWLDNTAKRIAGLQPKKVLEVGVGTGMFLAKIAPVAESYLGIDIAEQVVDRVRQLIQSRPELIHAEVQVGAAHQLTEIAPPSLDTIIVNSVIQYFPNQAYLTEVLLEMISLLQAGGQIFVGDVRSYALLKAFHAAVNIKQLAGRTSREVFHRILNDAIDNEKELVVAPTFFYQLQELTELPLRVEVALKEGNYWNELSQYRYDVTITVGAPLKEQLLQWQDWDKKEWTLEKVKLYLAEHPKAMLGLKNIRNARVDAGVRTLAWASASDLTNDLGQFKAVLEQLTGEEKGISPQEFWQLEREYDCKILVNWSENEASGAYDVAIVPTSFDLAGRIVFPIEQRFRRIARREDYCNYPMQSELRQKIVGDVKRFLSERLPAYMIPQYITPIDEIPLTESGKIDRKALPSFEKVSAASTKSYVEPRNAIERTLVEIWAAVLKRTGISIQDDFFEIGGHSLRAIRLVSLMKQQLSVDIKLSEIFAHPTIEELAKKVAQEKRTNPIVLAAIPRIETQVHYALSNAQRRLWVLDQLEDDLTAYNIPAVLSLQGELNVELLEKVLQIIVERHEILRTRFIEIDGEGRQVIDRAVAFRLELQEVTSEDDYRALAHAHSNRIFDLEREHLLQVKLLKRSETEHVLLFNMHHIISDGWSKGILIGEISAIYNNLIQHKPMLLEPLNIQYKDYAAWQNTLLADEVKMGEMSNFWQGQLTDLPILDLPADFARPLIKTYEGANLRYVFPKELSQKLKTFSKEQGATLFMSLTALVNVLLHRYTNQDDIVIGTPTAGRNHADLHGQIGFYVNMLVLRNQVSSSSSFKDFLQQVKGTTLQAFEHEFYPFDRLVEELDLPRDMSRSVVFDVMVILQNNEEEILSLGDVDFRFEEVAGETSKFDLTFDFVESGDELIANISYSTDLFRQDRMERMLEHLECLIHSVLSDEEQPIGKLNLVPAKEQRLLLNSFNDTARDYPLHKTLVQLFEEQVEKTPDNTAIIFKDISLTYRELNEKANQVAIYLHQEHETKNEDLIALQMERSEWMIIAILGVFKSGAAYLPVAPDFPEDRVAYLLTDSGAKLLLCDHSTSNISNAFVAQVPVENIESLTLKGSTALLAELPLPNPQALAYIVYTSGSTGQPKGVMIEHSMVINFLYGMQEALQLVEEDMFLATSTYTFDMSVMEFFMPLLKGASILQTDSSIKKSPLAFQQLIDAQQPTHMQATTSLWRLLLESGWTGASHMKLMTGGEALPPDLANSLLASSAGLWNLYGPTEATVYSNTCEIKLGEPITIGSGMGNVKLYILNESLSLCPLGVAGEVHISSPGLAREYLNKPALTAEKFIPNPFEAGDRLYKTGDLACWLPDGNIEFLGRTDFQLKIRGHRIEAGEIEQVLLTHEEIQSVVVIGYDFDYGKDLVAYLVPMPGHEVPGVQELRTYLGQTLPDYMIPSYFVALEGLPHTRTGKINRKALPKPEITSIGSGVEYVAPTDAVEEQLVDIWQEVLKKDKIGINDNFFNLGGQSLKAIKLASRIAQHFEVQFSLSIVFKYPRLSDLARYIIEEADNTRIQSGMLLSGSAQQLCLIENQPKIFTFPPALGLAMFFQHWAHLLEGYALYAFDFLGDNEVGSKQERLEHYYQEIKEQQAAGPYRLMGYSAGGNLAFELAQYFEAKGEVVSDLIILDSAVLTNSKRQTSAEMQAAVDGLVEYTEKSPHADLLQDLLADPSSRKAITERILSFYQYLNTQLTLGEVAANIHLLQSGDVYEAPYEDTRSYWEQHTGGEFRVVQGTGEHIAMFEPPYLADNAAKVLAMLERTEVQATKSY